MILHSIQLQQKHLKDDDDMTVYSGIKVLQLHIGEQHIPDLASAILREISNNNENGIRTDFNSE